MFEFLLQLLRLLLVDSAGGIVLEDGVTGSNSTGISYYVCVQVGIARAVHTDENKQYLQQVVNAYPEGTFKPSDLLAVQRSTGASESLLVQEDVALRDSHKTAI